MKRTSLAILMTLSARVGATLGGVLLSLVVARLAGPDGLGRFTVFLSLVLSLMILACHGKDVLLIRAVAWAEGRAQSGTSAALFKHGVKDVLFPAFVLGGIASAVLASNWLGVAFDGAIAITPLVLPLLVVLALVSGYAKGRSRAWIAPLFEIGGISMLAALILVGLSVIGAVENETAVMLAFLAAMLLLVPVAGLLIWRDMPRGAPLPFLDHHQKAELRTGQMDFTLIALATFLTQAGSFMLAAPFLTEPDLGLLRAAERIALLVSFPVLAINPVIAPLIVRLEREGDASGLRRLVLRAILASTGVGVCVLLPLLIWPGRALALMGPEFGAAVPYLRVMALAQFLAALAGPLMVLLNMSGRERPSMWINVGTLALALGIIPLACIVFGALGFALAYSVVILLRLGLIGVIVAFGRKPVSSRDAVNS